MTAIIQTGQPSPAEQEFQQRMQDRLRQAMGDLMPDEVLKGIVARGVEQAFFADRIEKDRWGSTLNHRPSWMVEFLQRELQQRAKQAVEKWFAENQAKVEELLQKALAMGLASAVVQGFNELLREPFQGMKNEVADLFRRLQNP